jgi:hypothetical protein
VVDESLLGYCWHNCAALVVDDDVQKPALHMQLAIVVIVDEAELAELVHAEFESGARRPHF